MSAQFSLVSLEGDLCSTVGWCDLALLRVLEMDIIAVHQEYWKEFNFFYQGENNKQFASAPKINWFNYLQWGL